ncbi:MAG: penicillin-binding transpeptidase domain-containing protein [Coprobacillaceae bacterium]
MAFKIRDKIPSVHFEGFSEEQKRYRNTKDVVVSKRLLGLLAFLLIITLILGSRLAYIQLTQQSLYELKLDEYGTNTYTRDANRGEIVDRNNVKLVSNTTVSTAVYYAPKSITSEEIETTANFLVDNITIDTSVITERQKKDFFIIACPDEAKSLISDEEKKEIEGQSDEAAQLNSLMLKYLTDEFMDQYMDETLLKKTRLIFLMEQCTSGSSVLIETLSEEDASKIGANSVLLKGVRVTSDWTRNYDQGNNFSRVLGKVTTKKQGLTLDQREELLALDYQNDARIGVSGLEMQYESLLRGTDTKYTLSYDENGNPIPVYTNADLGQNGSNLRISIDWELQAYADQVIEDELRSASQAGGNEKFDRLFIILMDPNNGDIIVMSGKQYDRETDEMIDYAIGNYQEVNMIGSTTKGATIYAGFKEGIIDANTVYMDEPIKIKGTQVKKSWSNLGSLTPVRALARSSNVYMFRIAMEMGGANYVYDGPLNINFDAFDKYREDIGELGLGVKTGLDVTDEAPANRGTNPQAGNLLDLVIGQYDTYTNIQLAQYTATLANGGKRIQPRLLLEAYTTDEAGNSVTTYQNDVTILDDVSEYSEAMQTIKEGYQACVSHSDGLCRTPWASKGYTTYAKTGTAQVIQDKQEYYNKLVTGWADDGEGNAKVVFSCIGVRNGKSNDQSGSSAMSISSLVMDKYYEKYPN